MCKRVDLLDNKSCPESDPLRVIFACYLTYGCESRSRQVLECDAEVLMVGLPGLALPDSALATAMLPSVPDMVDASIANSRLARRVARPAPAEAPSHPAPGKLPDFTC